MAAITNIAARLNRSGTPIDYTDPSFRDILATRCDSMVDNPVDVEFDYDAPSEIRMFDRRANKTIRAPLDSIASCAFYLNDDETYAEFDIERKRSGSQVAAIIHVPTSDRDASNELFALVQDVASFVSIDPVNVVDENRYGMVLVDDDEEANTDAAADGYQGEPVIASNGYGSYAAQAGAVSDMNGVRDLQNENAYGMQPDYGWNDAGFDDSFDDAADMTVVAQAPYDAMGNQRDVPPAGPADENGGMSFTEMFNRMPSNQPSDDSDLIDATLDNMAAGNEANLQDVLQTLIPDPTYSVEDGVDAAIDNIAPQQKEDEKTDDGGLDLTNLIGDSLQMISDMKTPSIDDVDAAMSSGVIDTAESDAEYAATQFDASSFDGSELEAELSKSAQKEIERIKSVRELAGRINMLQTELEKRLDGSENISALTGKIAELFEMNQQLKKGIESERRRVEHLTSERDEIQRQYDAQCAIVEQLERDYKNAMTVQQRAEKYIEDARKNVAKVIEEATAKVSAANETIDAAKLRYKEEHDRRLALERSTGQRIKQYADNEKSYQERIGQLTASLQKANEQKAQAQESAEECRVQMEEAFKQIDVAKDAESRAKQAQERMRVEQRALRVRIDSIGDDKSRAEQRLADVNSQLDESLRHTDELNSKIDQLEDQVSELKGERDGIIADRQQTEEKYGLMLTLLNDERSRSMNMLNTIGGILDSSRGRGWLNRREMADVRNEFESFMKWVNENAETGFEQPFDASLMPVNRSEMPASASYVGYDPINDLDEPTDGFASIHATDDVLADTVPTVDGEPRRPSAMPGGLSDTQVITDIDTAGAMVDDTVADMEAAAEPVTDFDDDFSDFDDASLNGTTVEFGTISDMPETAPTDEIDGFDGDGGTDDAVNTDASEDADYEVISDGDSDVVTFDDEINWDDTDGGDEVVEFDEFDDAEEKKPE